MAPYIPEELINVGSYVPTTNIWDVTEIFNVDVTSPQFKELLVRLYQNINNMAMVINTKETGFYITDQFATSQSWFNPLSTNQEDIRGGFRKVINFGPIALGLNPPVAHGLTITAPTTWKMTYIGGAATNANPVRFYPLPFAGAAGNNIEVRADNTNVIINNASGLTFTDAYVVLEFLKS